MNETIATLGGGCFWCLDSIYRQLKGVRKVDSGFSGGHDDNPSYRDIAQSGHAEVVQIYYDHDVVSFKELLEIFFVIHDPTTVDRQGADVGPQYRSIILYHNDEQKNVAEIVIAEMEKEKLWTDPIVTEIQKYEKFHIAEDYHQNYYNLNQSNPYCRIVIEPKIAKFRKQFFDKLKK